MIRHLIIPLRNFHVQLLCQLPTSVQQYTMFIIHIHNWLLWVGGSCQAKTSNLGAALEKFLQ